MSAPDQAAPELLPCPFCGKNAKLIKGKRVGFCVECQWCGSTTPNWRPDADRAKGDWNRRADLAAPSAPADLRPVAWRIEGYGVTDNEKFVKAYCSRTGSKAYPLQYAPSAPAEVEGLVERFDIYLDDFDHMTKMPCADGEWMRHADHATALTALQAEIERLEAIARQLADALHTADTIIADYTDIADEDEQQEIDNAIAAHAKLKGNV